MATKKIDMSNIDDDQDGEVQPPLDMSKPLGVQANDRINGKVDLPDSEREIVKPILLTLITPDLAQPRKAIPTVVSKAAKQDGIPEWQAWHRIAEALHGQSIDLKALLRGESDITPEEASAHPMVKGFLSLAGLAASINRDKLTNAITVVRVPGMAEAYEIETGERRWQAHRMLHAVLGKERFGKIKARIVEKASVWRQATENGQRDELTAIGKARQMALLLMDWYRENKGVQFLSYREIVGDSESNRAFYAQVANGNTFKVPDGHGDSFLQAIGLSNKSQLSRYRALLDLPDELWIQADEEDMAEGKIRAEMDQRSNGVRLPIGNHSDTSDAFDRPVYPPMSVKKGEGPGTKVTKDKVLYRGEVVEYHNSDARGVLNGFNVLIMHFDKNEIRTFSEVVHSRDIKDMPHPERGQPTGGFPSPADPFIAPKITYDAIGQTNAGRLSVGQRRQSGGHIYEIASVLGSDVRLAEINVTTGQPTGASFNTHANQVLAMTLIDKPVARTPEYPPSDLMAAAAASKAGTAAPGDDISKNIYQHYKTGALYRITFVDVIGRITGVQCDVNGRKTSSTPETFERGDLVLYQRVYDHIPQTETPVEPMDDGEDDDTEGGRATHQAPDNQLSMPPRPSWARVGEMVEHMNGKRGEIVTVVEDIANSTRTLTISTPTGPKTDIIDRFMPLDAPLDENTTDDTPSLPEWAVTGATVIHIPTNTVCVINDTVVNALEDRWYLRVMDSVGTVADVPLDECKSYSDWSPRTRHPGMEPKNLNNRIIDEQGDLRTAWQMATTLMLFAEADQITKFQALTPKVIDVYLLPVDQGGKGGEEGAIAEVMAEYEATMRPLIRVAKSAEITRDSAIELIRQKAAALRGE